MKNIRIALPLCLLVLVTACKEAQPPNLRKFKSLLGQRPVAFAPDGKILASGGSDRTVIIWDTKTWDKKQVLPKDNDSVTSVAFSPDGSLLAVASGSKIEVWDTRPWQLKHSLSDHKGAFTSIAFSPKEAILVAGSSEKEITLWDVQNGTKLRTVTLHKVPVSHVCFSLDGKIVFSCGQEIFFPKDDLLKANQKGEIIAWNVQSDEVKWAVNTSDRGVFSIALSPNGKSLAVAFGKFEADMSNNPQSPLDTIEILDTESGTLADTLRGTYKPFLFHSLSFSPNGRALIASDVYRPVKVWDLRTGESIQSLDEVKGASSMVFSVDGEFLAIAEQRATRAEEAMVTIWRTRE